MNIVSVSIQTESGCDISEGEYTVSITGLVGALGIDSVGGNDDVTLIKEAVDNAIMGDEIELREEGFKEVTLIESGEWEDVFWHKYYVIMPEVNNDRAFDI